MKPKTLAADIAAMSYPGLPDILGIAENQSPRVLSAAEYDRQEEIISGWNRAGAASKMYPFSAGVSIRRGSPLTMGELTAIHCYPGMGGTPTIKEMYPH